MKTVVLLCCFLAVVSANLFLKEANSAVTEYFDTMKRGDVDLCELNVTSSCVEPGDSCIDTTCDVIDGQLTCEFCSSFIDCDNGECPTTYDGLPCESDDDCVGDLTHEPFQCENNVCEAYEDYKLNNDPCEDDSECYGSNTCEDDVCTGVAMGQPCTDTRECVFNAYCNQDDDTCAALKTSGTCLDEDECALGYTCDNGTGTAMCIEWFSLGEDALCSEGFSCGEGLSCDGSSCLTSFAGGAPCDMDSDCPSNMGSTCECNIFAGESQCSGNGIEFYTCKDELDDALECVEENECKPNEIEFEDTCFSNNCGKELDEFIFCLNTLQAPAFGDAAECLLDLTPVEDDGDDDGDDDSDADAAFALRPFF